MKQLGLVRAGSRRERSAMSKSEARKFINQLIAHPRIRQKASELRPHEDISGYVIDHDLSPCQVVLSVRADAPLSLQHKQPKRGFPEEIPQDLYGWTNLGSQAQGRVVFWVMPTRIRQFTLIRARIIQDGAPAVGKAASVLEVRPRRALSSATASIFCQGSILVSITRLNSISSRMARR